MPFSQSEIDYPVSVPSGQPLSGTQENHMSLPWVTPKLYRDWHHSLQPSAACGFALCSASYLLVFSLMAQCPFYKGVSHASVYFTFFSKWSALSVELFLCRIEFMPLFCAFIYCSFSNFRPFWQTFNKSQQDNLNHTQYWQQLQNMVFKLSSYFNQCFRNNYILPCVLEITDIN